MRFFATFPATQHPFAKLFVEVEVMSEQSARDLMRDTFGTRWANLYTPAEWDSLNPLRYGERLALIIVSDTGRATTTIGAT